MAPRDWKAWRRTQRETLIADRRALSEADRRERNAAIDAWLEQGFGPVGGYEVGFCWPFAAEPEARFAVRRWRTAGSRVALPVVVKARKPLEFRQWWPGARMAEGVYGIPYPLDTPVRRPVVVLVPVNGFDDDGFRLGYGGGYFDRTLAVMKPGVLAIGLGYETARISTIYPRSHDIPLDFFVSETGILARTTAGVRCVAADEVASRVRARLESMPVS